MGKQLPGDSRLDWFEGDVSTGALTVRTARLDYLQSCGLQRPDIETMYDEVFAAVDGRSFVEAAYRWLLGRKPDESEFEHYASMIDDCKLLRIEVVAEIAESVESRRYLASRDQSVETSTVRAAHRIGRFRPEEIALPTSAAPVVSILIPVYQKVDYTLHCLASIARNPPRIPFEVLVLDDCSGDGSTELLERVEGVRLLQNPENLGFLRSCNRGARIANGRFLHLLNNDTEVTRGFVDELVDTLRRFPDGGLVGSKLVYPDGSLQEAGGIVWADASAWNFGRGGDPANPEFNFTRRVDYVSGASILIERSFFIELGLFDDVYAPAYYEDTDLAFKVRRAGRQVYFEPKSVVVHFEGISHGKDESTGLKAYQVRNREIFHSRWCPILESFHKPNGVEVFRARERLSNRPLALVVDHYVPQPDRDAGSRSMIHLMEALLQLGYVVKFWPHNHHYDPGYSGELERRGIEVLAGPSRVDKLGDWLLTVGDALTHVLLSRPDVAEYALETVRRFSNAKLVYYGHDIHHLRMSMQARALADTSMMAESSAMEFREKIIWNEIGTVYYPSSEEEAYVRQHWEAEALMGKVVRTIPVYAYPDREFTHEVHGPTKRFGVVFVAGFGHPPNVDGAIWLVEEIWPLIRQRFSGITLRLVGSNPTEQVQRLACADIEVTGFVTDEQLLEVYRSARVMVAPLRFGGGMKGKVIESMRFGVPCVTTSVGVQGLADTSGFLAAADSPREFADAVSELIADDELWTKRSAAARAFCRKNYSARALLEILRQDFPVEEVLSNGH